MFEHEISHYGTPLKIKTDQGTQFQSELFKALAGVQKIIAATYPTAW